MPTTVVKTLIYEIKWDDGDASKKADAWDRKLKDQGSTWINWGNIGARALNLVGQGVEKLADGFSKMITNSEAVEDSLSGVKRTANLSEDQITQLTKAVRELSSNQLQGAVSAEKLGEILEVAGQRGEIAGDQFEQTLQGALQFTEDIAKASQALDLSFGKTADALGKLQGPYGETTVSVGNLANSINVLADSTRAAAPEIINIAQRAAPALAAFRVGQGDLIGFSAAINALGISSYTGATALQTAFKQMTANTSAFAEAFGIDVEKLNNLVQTDITGAFTLLLEHINKMATETPAGTQKVAQALKDLKIQGAGVSTALLGLAGLGPELQSKFLDPANEGLTNMNSINAEFINSISRVSELWRALGTIWNNTIGAIGDAMLPMLRELLKAVNEQAIAFQNWFANSDFITNVLPGALDTLKGYLVELVQQSVAWVKSIDWSQLIQQVQAFVREIDFREVFDALKTIGHAFFSFMTDTLPTIIKLFESFWDRVESLVKTFNDFKGLIEPLLKLLEFGLKQLEIVIDAPTNALKGLYNLAQQFFPDFEGWISGAITKVAELGTKLLSLIPGMQKVEEEAYEKSLFPDMVMWAKETSSAIDSINSSLAATQASILNISDNLLTPQGLIGKSRASRSNPQNGLPQIQTGGVPAPIQGGMPESMNITLVAGDQEIGNWVAVTEDYKQQQEMRSFGGRWR